MSDLGAVRDQQALFGAVASDSTAFRTVDKITSMSGGVGRLAFGARQGARAVRELHGAPERLTIDVDATLITAPPEKEQAAGNYKGGYGFHPLQVYLDEDPGGAGRFAAAG